MKRETRDKVLWVRVRPEIKTRLEAAARADDRTLTSEVAYILHLYFMGESING